VAVALPVVTPAEPPDVFDVSAVLLPTAGSEPDPVPVAFCVLPALLVDPLPMAVLPPVLADAVPELETLALWSTIWMLPL